MTAVAAHRPDRIRIGAGAGFAGDRIDPAVDLIRHGALDYVVFECLGERTVASAHARMRADPAAGYDPLFERRLRATLQLSHAKGTRIITNSGAANPQAAGELALRVASELGLHGLRIAVITGDDVLDLVRRHDPIVWETGEPASHLPRLVSANAYLGAGSVVAALDQGADVVITGRVADPSLYVGPLRHEFHWSEGDFELLGRGTLVGHLLECAGQLTGGYFADPITKPVPNMATLGFPFADVAPDGSATLGKTPGSGGRLDTRTCGEQLLYEVDEPDAYVTPDVVADFSEVSFTQLGRDSVRPEGASGKPRTDSLKVTLGLDAGWLGEGQISYAGPRCLGRAQLAADITRERLSKVHGIDPSEINVEFLGTGAAFRGLAPANEPSEVRVRVTATGPDRTAAEAVAWEVESLYTNGPAGGGGARGNVTPQVAIRSCLLPRALVTSRVEVMEAP